MKIYNFLKCIYSSLNFNSLFLVLALIILLAIIHGLTLAQLGDENWDARFNSLGLNDPAYALAESAADLNVEREFAKTGGKPSYNFAHWTMPLNNALETPVRFPRQDSDRSLYESCPIALSNGDLFMVWGTYDSLAFSRSTDSSSTWGAPNVIDSLTPFPRYLNGLQSSSGRIIVTWRNMDAEGLLMSYSDDNGSSWSAVDSITSGDDRWTSMSQTLDGTLWLYYGRQEETTGRDIYYISSSDDGNTWSSEQTLRATSDNEWFATIVNGNTSSDLIIFFSDNSSGNDDIYYITSSDSGQTWSSPLILVNDSQDERRARALRQADGTLWMIYERRVPSPVLGIPEYDNYYMQSTDGGSTWSAPQQFTSYVRHDVWHNVDLLGNQPFVSFASFRWANIDQYQIWYGIIGTTFDSIPPPALYSREIFYPVNNSPAPMRATVDDESGIANVELTFELNGTPAGPIQMYDDGLHNDDNPGDNIWGAEYGPLQFGDEVSYSFSISDISANTIDLGGGSFNILAVHDTGNVILSFRDNSQLADRATVSGLSGISAYYPASDGQDYLYLGGLWIGADLSGDQRVMNLHYNETDWTQTSGTPFTEAHNISDQDWEVTYDDQSNPPNPLGLQVHQQSYQWSDPNYDDFIIYTYTVTNTGLNGDLNDLYVALWSDPDLSFQTGTHFDDLGGYDSQRGLAYLYDSENNPEAYFGIKLLGDTPHTVNIHPGFNEPGDDLERFTFMTDGIISPSPDPADYRILLTAPPFNLADGASHTVAFALVMGNGLSELQAHADSSTSKYSDISEINVDFSASISISDNCAVSTSLEFGTAVDATDGYDSRYDQYAPPLPPSGVFDARFRTGPEDFFKDYRATNTSTIIWNILCQPTAGCEPITLSWNPAELPEGNRFWLVDHPTNGTLVNIDMGTTNSFTDSLGLGQFDIVFSVTSTFSQDMAEGWNMIGLPLDVVDRYYLSIYPNAFPNTLYGFKGSYISEDSLQLGDGYWLRFPGAETVQVEGYLHNSLTIDLSEKWNMIGGVSCNVALNDVVDPGGIIIPGTLFGFDDSYYATDSIKQGEGYWIRASDSGQISLSCGTTVAPVLVKGFDKLQDLGQFPSIQISDASGASQILYFDVKLEDSESKLYYSMPPLPPFGAFDVRFSGDYRICEDDEEIIHIQSSHYPLTVNISYLKEEEKFQYVVEEVLGGEEGQTHILNKGSSVEITNSAVKKLRLFKKDMVPLVFMVKQNYPNPFNPETIIKYGIPNPEKVEIEIYNTLGQKVITLLSKEQKAGYHEVLWDGINAQLQQVSSGIYFYKVQAGEYLAIRKMIFLK